METTHKHSHIVYFRRAPLFANESRKELEDYFANSSRAIGAYFTKGSTRDATGLTITEENLLMPHMLSIDKTDRDFRAQVNNYFRDIDSKIPAGTRETDGLALEIGLEKGGTDMDENNMPINVEHYIRCKHALGHPQVASSPELAKGNQLIQYFMYDPKAASTTAIDANQLKDNALQKYLTIKDNPKSVRMYLTLLGVNPATVKKGEELIRLRALAENNPTKFMEVANNKNQTMEYTIRDMINVGVLKTVGDRILTTEGTVIGRDMHDAVLHLLDAQNSKSLAFLKSQQQEAWKKTSVSVDTIEDLDPSDRQVIEETKANDPELGKNPLPVQPEPEIENKVEGALDDVQ